MIKRMKNHKHKQRETVRASEWAEEQRQRLAALYNRPARRKQVLRADRRYMASLDRINRRRLEAGLKVL